MPADIKCEMVFRSGRPDVVVLMDKQPVLVIECKRPGKSFKHLQKYAFEQAEAYAEELHVNRTLITSGDGWLLVSGHKIVVEAKTREEFVERIGDFYRWLNVSELWCLGTGLVFPTTDFDSHDFVKRAWRLEVNGKDILRTKRLSEETPYLGARVEEELRKSLSVYNQRVRTKEIGSPKPFSVLHVDNTFAAYRAGAWSYDPLYRLHLKNERLFLNESRRLGIRDAGVRLFIVKQMSELEKIRLIEVSKRMLRDGWTIGILTKSVFKSKGINPCDIIGDYYTSYSEELACGFNLKKVGRRAQQYRNDVRDLFSTFPDNVFRSNTKDSIKLLAKCVAAVPA